MKKSLLFIVGIFLLGACDSSKNVETMTLGGVEYDSKYVRSGYYFDKASLSEATLADMLSKVEVIEKPENLGKVQLPDFASIELESYPIEEVDDLMIEAEIERERDLETVYNPVTIKREAKDGDKVIIDFKGYVDGEELEGGSGEDFELVLGSGQFIPGFEEGVIGHTAGKKFNIDVTFPEDYTPELQGKPAKFEITIKSIEEPVTPEVNEEFIAKHSTTGAKTIDEYKIEVRERVEKRNEFTYNQSLSYQLYDIILTEGIFEPTEEALAWGFSTLFSQMNQQAEMSGTDIATVLASNGSTVKQAYDEIKAGMPEFIKPELLLDALSDRYKIELSEEEVKTWTENLLVMMGYGNEMTYEEYKNSVGYEALLNNAKFEKALLRAVKECKLVEITEEE